MPNIWVRFGVAVGVTALSAIPIAWASSSGALPGHSGGPAGGGTFCHACHGPFNPGTGFVEVLGAPARYRAGEFYDLTVRITAPDQDGAGFETSAEGISGHAGALILTDGLNTRYAGDLPDYITHTFSGLANSRAEWVANGGSYDYHFRWQAPLGNAGPVTFFTSANAVDNLNYFSGVRYYRGYAKSLYARPGDVDGDSDVELDVDLADHALQADCLTGPGGTRGAACEFADTDGDGDVDLFDIAENQTLFTGATATNPPEFVLADVVRGGLLYDKWWLINRSSEPTGNHPLYPAIGQKSGSTTFRCKECHGWDYKGVNGAYGSGTHFTGITGVFGTTLTPQQVFDLLSSPDTANGGHDMIAYGMTDVDLWDVTKMVLEGVIDTNDYIDGNGAFRGDPGIGQLRYGTSNNNGACATCHNVDGRHLDFGGGVYVGTVANANPWELLHKVRFGHPASPMPSFELLGWPATWAADVGAHAATLPQ